MKIMDIKKKYDQVINVSDYIMYLWISRALDILPNDVCSQLLNTLAIYSTIDACRVDRATIEKQKEIIFISRSILPEINSYKNKSPYETIDGRYFIFTILHEIAHAFLKHKSPKNDNLDSAVHLKQEREADEKATEWFNKILIEKKISIITADEIDKAREKSKEFWTKPKLENNHKSLPI